MTTDAYRAMRGLVQRWDGRRLALRARTLLHRRDTYGLSDTERVELQAVVDEDPGAWREAGDVSACSPPGGSSAATGRDSARSGPTGAEAPDPVALDYSWRGEPRSGARSVAVVDEVGNSGP